MGDKRDRAITCVFCRDLHLTLMFSRLLQKHLFKVTCSLSESFSNEIIVTCVTQGLLSSFSPVLLRKFTIVGATHAHYTWPPW